MKRLLLLTAALCACSPPENRPASPGLSRLSGLTIAESAMSDPRWLLKASGARIEEKSGRMYFALPRITFYEGAAVASEITAASGELGMREKEAELTGSVQVDARRDGMRLTTTKLYYSSARAKIWTTEPVVIHKGKAVITGSGFTANPDLSEIELTKQETRMTGA